jgi:hypothetical protein
MPPHAGSCVSELVLYCMWMALTGLGPLTSERDRPLLDGYCRADRKNRDQRCSDQLREPITKRGSMELAAFAKEGFSNNRFIRCYDTLSADV